MSESAISLSPLVIISDTVFLAWNDLLQTLSFVKLSELNYLLQLIDANESPEYNVSCYANSIKVIE